MACCFLSSRAMPMAQLRRSQPVRSDQTRSNSAISRSRIATCFRSSHVLAQPWRSQPLEHPGIRNGAALIRRPSKLRKYVCQRDRKGMDARWQCELAGKVSTRMNNTSNAALIAIVVIFAIALTLA
jgi:hypothetical protein